MIAIQGLETHSARLCIKDPINGVENMMMQSRSSSLLTFIVSLVITAIGIPVNVMAQGGVIEEIIVTARQREEKLTDVPASITAFTAGTIKRANIERAEDFIALTPGVSFIDTAEVGDSQVSIRGINGSRDAEANFAFIVDGILHTEQQSVHSPTALWDQ